MIWRGPRPLWGVGDWTDDVVRQAESGSGLVAVIGCCMATDSELFGVATAVAAGKRPDQLPRLAGSCVTVIDDGRTVTVSSDLAGLHAVFSTRYAGGVMFASSALPLAALHGYRVDAGHLAAKLFCPEIPGAAGDTSMFSGVSRVPAGDALILEGGTARIAPGAAAVENGSVADAIASLREVLTLAVARRVTQSEQTSTDLSGGLDSSALALLAARHSQAQVLAITYADGIAGNSEDLHYAEVVATAQPRLRRTIVHGNAGTLPFTAMEETPYTDEPTADAVLFARTRARLAPAAGGTLHIAGDGGDVVLAGPLTYLADLAQAKRVRWLVREATAWARLRHHPAHAVIMAAIRTGCASWSDTLASLAAHLDQPPAQTCCATRPVIVWAALSPCAQWGTQQARRRVAHQIRQALDEPPAQGHGAAAHAWRLIRWHAAATRSYLQIASALRVRAHVPYFDNQVIAACMSVPAVDRTSALQVKPLLVAALRGVAPPELLRRRTKGDYTACEYHGLRRNLDPLRELLDAPLLAELGILDPAPVARVLEAAAQGMSTPLGALITIVATETWLRRLTTQRRNWWASIPNVPEGP